MFWDCCRGTKTAADKQSAHAALQLRTLTAHLLKWSFLPRPIAAARQYSCAWRLWHSRSCGARFAVGWPSLSAIPLRHGTFSPRGPCSWMRWNKGVKLAISIARIALLQASPIKASGHVRRSCSRERTGKRQDVVAAYQKALQLRATQPKARRSRCLPAPSSEGVATSVALINADPHGPGTSPAKHLDPTERRSRSFALPGDDAGRSITGMITAETATRSPCAAPRHQ